jgi:hypothetical protein
MGYTTVRPRSVAADRLSVAEGLLGLFFIAIFVAKAVATMK